MGFGGREESWTDAEINFVFLIWKSIHSSEAADRLAAEERGDIPKVKQLVEFG